MRAKSTQRSTVPRKNDDRKSTIIILGALVFGAIALGALLYLNTKEPEALDGLIRLAGLSRGHDPDVVYEGNELPPVGGLHDPVWQNCGIYDESVETKHVIHSLEHGAVWITYHPDLPVDDVKDLQDAVRDESFVLLSPYPELKSPVVLTAWGIQLEVDAAGDSRIAQFIDRYQQGPQSPEPGASCVNGTGTPLS
jgi:hypothetical protein